MGGSLGYGLFEIAGHAHGEVFDAGSFCKGGKHPEMIGRVFFGWRDAHQAFDRQTEICPEVVHKLNGIFRQYACLLDFPPGIDLDEKPGRSALPLHFGCDRCRNLFPVHSLDDIEERNRQRRLVALQWADQVQFDIRKVPAQFRPLCGSFLDTVLSEDALSDIKYRSDMLGIEILADRYKLHGARFPIAFAFGLGDAGSDSCEFAGNVVQIGYGP